MSRRLIIIMPLLLILMSSLLPTHNLYAQSTPTTMLISRGVNGEQFPSVDQSSTQPISDDGSIMVYASGNGSFQGFIRRRASSIPTPIPGRVMNVAISGNGQFAVYNTVNEISPGYVGCSGVELLNISTMLTQPILPQFAPASNGVCLTGRPFISGDGRYVIYWANPHDAAIYRWYIFDRNISSTEEIHVFGIDGRELSWYVTPESISEDARYIVFQSASQLLVPNDTNTVGDVFLLDRNATSNPITRVSVSSTGAETNQTSGFPLISGDGKFVVFYSAGILDPADTDEGFNQGGGDAYIHDVINNTTRLLRVNYNQTAYHIGADSISTDGRYVGVSTTLNQLSAEPVTVQGNVYYVDTQISQAELISKSTSGVTGNGVSGIARVSGNGRFVLFQSSANNLDANDTNSSADLFLRDRIGDAILTYSISGKVLNTANNPMPNVTISVGSGYTTTSLNDGSYTLNNLPQGNYTITPSLQDYTFSPPNINVQVPLSTPVPNFIATPAIIYIALGDSFSSGEGVPPFISGSDGPTDYCHRSTRAYSQVLSNNYARQYHFYACSGATTSDITNTLRFGEPAQATQPKVNRSASLVTMTIGGNDANFRSILETCIRQRLIISSLIGTTRTPTPVEAWLNLGIDPSCANAQNFVNSVNNQIDQVLVPARDTYAFVRSAVDPVETSILVAGYPHLFSDNRNEQSCLQLAALLTPEDQTYFNQSADRLNGVLSQAANQAGVTFIDVQLAFKDHSICGSKGSWINGLSIASGSGQPCVYTVQGQCIYAGLPVVGSFHPNASGQMEGYAGAYINAIQSASMRTRLGFPRNPIPVPANSTSSTESLVDISANRLSMNFAATTLAAGIKVQALTVQTVAAGSPDCYGTVQPGQLVSVNGDGFAPGGTVQLYVTSPGLVPSIQQLVGQLTADTSGHIATILQIPLNATGFAPTGSIAGLVFVDAIGLGVDNSHVDDVATIGIVPNNGPCGTLDSLAFKGFLPLLVSPPTPPE